MTRLFSLLGAAATVLALSPLQADHAHADEAARGPWVFSLAGAAAYQFDTGLDNPGSFSVTRWFVQPSVGYAWDRRNSVLLSFGAGQNLYDFADSTDIGGGKPWQTVRDFRLSVPIRFSPMEQLDAIVIPSVRSFTESGVSLDDGRTEGVIAGGKWRFSPTFAIGPGIGWFTKLGGGSNVFPIILLDWNITDTITLSTGSGLAATEGPGLTLSWEATEQVSLGLTGRYEKTRFRLDDSGPAPGGIGEDRSFPILASVQYRPWPMASLSAFAGVETFGRLRLEKSGGDRLDESDYDPAPLIGVTFRGRF